MLRKSLHVNDHDGHHVHRVLDKLLLDRADEQPEDVLDGEEDDDEVVDEVDDGHDDRVVGLALLVLLQLLDGGEDEGDGGDEHHGQGEESNKLSKPVQDQDKTYIPVLLRLLLAGPWIFKGVPSPGTPLAELRKN